MLLFDRAGVNALPETEAALTVGTKSLGLRFVPDPWCPPFVVIPTALYRFWKAGGFEDVHEPAVGQLLDAIRDHCGPDVILRSSATTEGVAQRGRYQSVPFRIDTGSAAFLAALAVVYQSYDDAEGAMAIIAHTRIDGQREGYLSNQIRAAAKPYQWVIQEDVRTATGDAPQPISTSAKQAHAYPEDTPLMSATADELSRRLKSAARYFWQAWQGSRQLLEWVWDGSRLWIVQHDAVVEDQSGIDPRTILAQMPALPEREDGVVFRRFAPGTSSVWNKLRKVSSFSTGGLAPPHRLFFASGDVLERENTPAGRSALAAEIDSLTAGRAVLRTDLLEVDRFNLNRTNTVSGAEAVDFIFAELIDAEKAGIAPAQIVFILHAFIHARSAAWTYYRRDSGQVRVDGLWGLADGIQFYPHDTFIYDPALKRELSDQRRFKSHILCEQPDGRWTTETVRESLARHRSLTKSEVADMALRTVEIAGNLDEDVQIMWFVGIPPAFQLGDNLPWYLVKAGQPIEERRSHLIRSLFVRNRNDLEAVSQADPGSTKVVFEPAGDDIRNNGFINDLGRLCAERNLPIELRGSILAHGFHQLRETGAQVFSAEPGKKPLELRQRKAFDKLVRDEIPRVISEGGEFVEADQIDRAELLPALAGKIVEEVEELLRAQSDSERIDELADVYEVIRAMIAAVGTNSALVAERADVKRSKRGGFDHGIILRATQTRKDQDHLLFEEPQGSARTLRLSDLATRMEKGSAASIPISELFDQAGHRQFSLKLHGTEVRLSIELRGGRVSLRLHQTRTDGDPNQGDFFRI